MTLPVPFCQDVSAPSSFFLFIPAALSPASLFQLCVSALRMARPFLNVGRGVSFFSFLCSSDVPCKRLVNRARHAHYETKLASSWLLVSLLLLGPSGHMDSFSFIYPQF